MFEFDFNMSWPSFPSREGTAPPSPSREGTETVLRSEADGGESRQEKVVVGASAEDAEAAERSPLQLPESLIRNKFRLMLSARNSGMIRFRLIS